MYIYIYIYIYVYIFGIIKILEACVGIYIYISYESYLACQNEKSYHFFWSLQCKTKFETAAWLAFMKEDFLLFVASEWNKSKLMGKVIMLG